jgi:hypothetical protein
MSDSNTDAKKRKTVNETCTVSAWISALQELEKINPDAVLTTREYVLNTEQHTRELWTKSGNVYDENRRHRLESNEVSGNSFFNIVFIERNDEHDDRRRIVKTLDSQDIERESNQHASVRQFLDSLNGLDADGQLARVRSNTKFRTNLYFFRETGEWITTEEAISMCGGKLYYNFDELFENDPQATFIKVCRIPYDLVARTLLRDPVRELLRTYQASKTQ